MTMNRTVALSLNGKLLDEKKVEPFQMAEWQVPYAPGRLEAVAKKDGREVARFTVETTGDGRDAVPVTVEAIDANGRPVPTANLPVEFDLTGPGTNIGVGNGDPNSHDPEKGNRVKLYNSLAQIILQSQRAGSGDLVLRATSAGLKSAAIAIEVRTVPAIPSVP